MNRQLVSVTDAVPYQEFAKLIGKTPRAVRGMIEKGKLPVIEITDPQSVSGRAGEYWVYLAGVVLVQFKPGEVHAVRPHPLPSGQQIMWM